MDDLNVLTQAMNRLGADDQEQILGQMREFVNAPDISDEILVRFLEMHDWLEPDNVI